MTEADVWRAIIATLREGLDNNGQSSLLIKQAFQPTKQGVDIQDTVYIHKITSSRIGWQGSKDTYDVLNDRFDVLENYWLEATFQLNAVIERDITDSNSLTAYDIVDLCAAILSTRRAESKLRESNIGILRIGEIRNPYHLDDREQFDQDSSFDFKLTYNQTISNIVPVASPICAEFQRV